MKKYKDISQGTAEWLHKKKGVITGTVLKSIMGTPKARQDAIYEAIAERLTVGVEEEYENPMERGVRLEPDAIAVFELETNKSVERIGFAEDDDNQFIGNSPDGFIGDDEAIEVKCMGGKNHVKMWLTNEIPVEYYWQAIQYFIVNERLQRLYFVGYNPDIPIHKLHTIEMKREDVEKQISIARKNQEAFIAEVNAILETIIKL